MDRKTRQKAATARIADGTSTPEDYEVAGAHAVRQTYLKAKKAAPVKPTTPEEAKRQRPDKL